MKWLEGWFGVASGVLGIVWVTSISLLAPVSVQHSSQTCMASSSGVTICYGPDGSPVPTTPVAPGPNIGLLIFVGVVFLLFIGVLVGTWLDLHGVRTAGRVILLVSATLLLFMPPASLGAFDAPGVVFGSYAYLLAALAFTAGILACVRRDAPRPAPIAPQG